MLACAAHKNSRARQQCEQCASAQLRGNIGGSSGIGRGYANELVKRGLHIVIVSSVLQALNTAAKEITSQYGVKCRYIQVDLSHDNAYEHVFSRLKDTDVGISVNCAGVVGDFPCRMLNESDMTVNLMLALHIKAMVHTTRLFLPSMLARKRAAIVTVSSMASVIPCTFSCVYSACKAFSDRFTRALSYEYKWKNVSFQSLTPFVIWTKMVEEHTRNFEYFELIKSVSLDRDKFVKNAIRTINLTNYTSGNWFCDIVLYAAFSILNIYLHIKVARIKISYKI
ncbi:very-long-chain 3-oxoacyl-CoA reductase-like [Centruroides sculpturatus]|uniref:very-long-chain 3-oxoacyl-CoA reductase-like n=1 Tax=Centruroides sculpturatus TaxID=218467 RepID=UPI000C6DC490|nr:very-long-chain 3-oxoacyl-CoA reductase-like [Centruroides sculpturatus]